ncbi:MAG: lysoplasmalogenase [Clostridiaceae bacterium]|nr:lysoplasmalogenase [Clostridiaceae bacterium]
MDAIIFAAFLVAYGLNLFFTARKSNYGSIITKLLLTPMLYLFYLFRNDTPELIVFFALLFCFFGDLFMEFSEKESFFILGLTSFLVGHIFYIICFSHQIINPVSWWLFLFLLVYAGYGLSFYRILNLQGNKLRVPVVLYCGVIFLMSFLAILRVQSVSTVRFLLTFSGSLLFIASDSILAYNKFNKKVKHAGILIMSTYGMAQLLIISGL